MSEAGLRDTPGRCRSLLWFGVLVGVGVGLLVRAVAKPKRDRRTTYGYWLKDGKKKVYRGITDDPVGRVVKHAQSKTFTTAVVDKHPTSRATARSREVADLIDYRSRNGGKNPKYNKKRNG